jgi:hypothetical protein
LDQRDRDVLVRDVPRGGQRLGRGSTVHRWLFAASLGALSLFAAATALGGPRDVVVLPVAIESASRTPAEEERVRGAAALVDATLRDTVGDLGLEIDPKTPATDTLETRPGNEWLIAPHLSLSGPRLTLRLVAVAPGSRVELAREERFDAEQLASLEVRTVVMLRELYDAGRRAERDPEPDPRERAPLEPSAPPSSGRAVLALNSAALGGYFGFTMQRASGSRDTRLVYPLVALGAGLGLGASLLVADEWDVGYGDAWYIAAGAWWPAGAGLLLADAYGAEPQYRFAYSLVAAMGGAGLATLGIAGRGMSEGDAVLAHSGGAFGALFGAMVELGYRGETAGSVKRGLGWGATTGVLALGAVATQVNLSATRVLLLDLSTSLGGLAGAAAASPLLLVDESDATRTRLWLASAGVGAIAGGVIGWIVTSSDDPQTSLRLPALPYASVLPTSAGGTSFELGAVGHF